jgi:hypothetical protein
LNVSSSATFAGSPRKEAEVALPIDTMIDEELHVRMKEVAGHGTSFAAVRQQYHGGPLRVCRSEGRGLEPLLS